MASGEISAIEEKSVQETVRLGQVRTGWVRTIGVFKETVLWIFKVGDLVQSSLAKLRNESRLRKAYRDLGEFLFQRMHDPELDEADQVEFDLLMGRIAEIRVERDRLIGDSENSDRTGLTS